MLELEEDIQAKSISKADFDFVRQMPLFESIPQRARLQLFLAVKRIKVSAGTRIICQGDKGDSLYIVRRGTCSVCLEKDGVLHPVAVVGPGRIVGEMAVLTGENRSAHVDAKTDMDLWRIGREDFEEICREHEEVRHFLTGLVTSRLERLTVTPDRTIGKYIITDVIGRGGGSIVYKGVHSTLNMTVAIKMLKHKLAMNPRFLERFQSEARIIGALNHENIVKVYDIENRYKTVFIVMEFVDGETLETLLQQTPRLPISEVVGIVLQVCSGLGYAHKLGIVHRDIKPANIIVQRDGKSKILDFGLAGAPGASDQRFFEATPMYTPPERIKREQVDERSDIYSLGLTCFRMFTGREAFPDNNVARLLKRQISEPLPDPRSLVPELPEEIVAFLIQSTKKNPAERYQTVEEIIEALLPVSQRLGVSFSAKPMHELHLRNLLLFFGDQHEAVVDRLVEDFSQELEKIGVIFREADFKEDA